MYAHFSFSAIIICICNAFNGLSMKSKYLRRMFWISVSLVQISHVAIFQHALNLMQVVLKRLDKLGLFDGDLVSNTLMEFRADPLSSVLQKLDNAVGIHFVSPLLD